MKIDFAYWSCQCPLNHSMLELLEEYDGRLEISRFDITDRPALAKELGMFFPTLTIVEGRHRFYSPIGRGFLEEVCAGRIPSESPYRPSLGSVERAENIVPITCENYPVAGLCTGRDCAANCERKIQFLQESGLSVYGFMNIRDGELLGGAEYMPSLLVPYDIPKDGETAFITCVYRSDSEFDYKSAPLRTLERELARGYRRALVISDETGVFPNGDRAFFERNGYGDRGVVFQDGYCRLHLMEKQLPRIHEGTS